MSKYIDRAWRFISDVETAASLPSLGAKFMSFGAVVWAWLLKLSFVEQFLAAFILIFAVQKVYEIGNEKLPR